MSSEGKPRSVLENIHDHNHAALSAQGRKGAEVAQKNRDAEKKRCEAEKLARLKAKLRRNAEISRRDRQANVAVNDDGDVVPPDDLRH